MPHHHTRNTTEALAWCNTCGRKTLHRVSDRRIGACIEHGAATEDPDGLSVKQRKAQEQREKEAREPKLL